MTAPDSQAGRSLDRAVTGVAEAAPVLHSGVDVVGIDRIDRLLGEFGRSFKDRVFTGAERAYCDDRPDPAQHYAARWAAKEAFRKTVAADGPSVPFDAVGVERTADGPSLALAPPAEKALEYTLGLANADPERAAASVSLAHDQPAGIAIAHVVVACGDPGTAGASERSASGGER